MENPKPTILFVHGSWHQPSHFRPCRDVFEVAGFPTSCPLQPSIDTPSLGLMDDAQCIHDELDLLVKQKGQEVIVFAHSYGGLVSTQGVNEVFAKEKRAAQGQDGGVLLILYVCAFLRPRDVSIAGAFAPIFGGGLPPFIHSNERRMCIMEDPAQKFYQDLPEAAQEHWVSQLRESPTITQMTGVNYCAYLHHPVAYLYCTNDAGIPHVVQQGMVKNISESCNLEIKTMVCESGHSPFLSMPEKVLGKVKSLVV